MMTISPPVAASQAADYYQNGSGKELLESFAADEIKQSNFQAAKSGWSGGMADKLDLNGEVGQADFEKVLDGVNPLDEQRLVRHRRVSRPKIIEKAEPETGEEMVGRSAAKIKIITVEATGVEIAEFEAAQIEISRIKNTQPSTSSTRSRKGKTSEHRACWDITFSAPKSVSLAAIVGGDLRLIEIHRQAVATALREVENFAEARLGGNQPPERTGKLLMASFEHYAARPDKKENFAAADLHTHNPVMNFTFAENGKSYALQPQKLFAAQKLGTAVYRLELAKGMNEIGYEIRFDEQTKAPEIAAISREYIEAVSPRQTEIKAKAKELNISSTRQIVVRHRSAKNEKSADSFEFHLRIEKSFDNQARTAVEESFVNTKISQPAIIEQFQAEVTLQRTKIFKKAEKRQNYYAAKQLNNQNNEQTGIEGKTRTIEAEADSFVTSPKIGVVIKPGAENERKRIENDAVAVVPTSRNITVTAGRQIDGSSLGHQPDRNESQSNIKSRSNAEFRDSKHQSDAGTRRIELGDETENRSGSQQTLGETERDQLAEFESSGGAAQKFRKQNRGNQLESAASLGRDENSGSENDFEPQIDGGKASEFAKSNSSEGTARSGTDEVETVTSTISDQAVPTVSRSVGTAKTVAPNTAVKQSHGAYFADLLRADEYEPQLIGGTQLQPERFGAKNSNGISRLGSAGDGGRDLSEITSGVEVSSASSKMAAANFHCDGQLDGILTDNFSDSGVLAGNSRDAVSDFGNNTNHFDIHFSDVQPRAGNGIHSVALRIDDHIWGDLLPVESALERPAVRSGEIEFLNAGTALDDLSATSPIQQFADPIPKESGFSPSFIEIEQIFAAQKLQETLAAEIVGAANEQRRQNQQTEINQAVQEKMFAYLMQLADGSAQNAFPSNDNSASAMQAAHQNFLTDEERLERFTRTVEERHFNEERTARIAAENSAQNNKSRNQTISDEGFEEYEDHPDFEEERGFSLRM